MSLVTGINRIAMAKLILYLCHKKVLEISCQTKIDYLQVGLLILIKTLQDICQNSGVI